MNRPAGLLVISSRVDCEYMKKERSLALGKHVSLTILGELSAQS